MIGVVPSVPYMIPRFQAPVSMKSGIMAGWLLTVAVGNALVVMLAENPVTDNMVSLSWS